LRCALRGAFFRSSRAPGVRAKRRLCTGLGNCAEFGCTFDMEKYRGEVVEVGDPLYSYRYAKLYITWLPEDKADIIAMCLNGNTVEFGFAHYDGKSLQFDSKETAECVLKSLLSNNKRRRRDTVYFEEDDSYFKYYFKDADVVFVAVDDYVYMLGSLSKAVETAEYEGEDVADAVRRFVETIRREL